MAAPEPPPPPEGSKPLSALLSGIAQAAYYGNADITEELLRGQLYPEAAPEEFRALRAKMSGLLQVPGLGGAYPGGTVPGTSASRPGARARLGAQPCPAVAGRAEAAGVAQKQRL
uniref:COMMD1 N-terminal domain-containing protein n=1 Tax=Otus sunia TaxID=257818 RepID=A0A8C8EAB2_9STRI